MSDFFDLPEETVSNTSTTNSSVRKVDENIFDPDPNSYNGKYTAVGRYVPYMRDKAKSKYTKYSAKFWNPLTRESLFVDCPSNVGKPSIVWTVGTVIGSIRNEEPDLYKELDEQFGRWVSHMSPIYIKKDPQRPDLEGTIKFFKFKKMIDDLIEAQLHPTEIDGIETSTKINPYNLLAGKDILFSVTKKTKTFRDWSKCKFLDDVTPFSFKIGDKTVVTQNDPKVIKLLGEFLERNTPDITPYLHKEWTEDTYEQVADAIIALLPRNLVTMVLAKSKDDKTNAIIKSKLGGVTSSAPDSSDDISFGSESDEDINDIVDEGKIPAGATVEEDDYDKLFEGI